MKTKNFAFTWQPYQHKVPVFEERRGELFVNYGIENDYPYYLLNLYQRSTKHNAIVNGKVGFIIGKGWTCENDNAAAFLDSPDFPNSYDSLDDLRKRSRSIWKYLTAWLSLSLGLQTAQSQRWNTTRSRTCESMQKALCST